MTGDYDIPEAIVRSEVTIKEGRAFRASTLAETQRRLFALGVFSMVNVVPDLSCRSEKIIPIRLELSESSYRQVKVGAGLSVESGKQDVHALAGFSTSMSSTDCGTSRPSFAPAMRIGDVSEIGSSGAETKGPTGAASVALTIPHFPARDRADQHDRCGVRHRNGYEFFSPYGPDITWRCLRSRDCVWATASSSSSTQLGGG